MDWSTACLNCGATLGGAFCADCGQRAAPPHPTLRQLGGEAFSELSGWDGKVAETMRALLRAPGKLTVEFLEGRRARYISPLRLYLTCSVIYFLIAAATPNRLKSSLVVTRGPVAGVSAPQNIVDATSNPDLTEEDRREIARLVAKAPPIIRPIMHRVSTDAGAFRADMLASMPKALFALLPVFAAIVAVFYRRRHFAEHLYFAFHVHAFVFIALSFAAVLKLTNVVALDVAASIAVLLWIPAYVHRSFRRVYGGTFGATLLKEIGIGTFYGAASIPVIALLALWVASR